MVSRRLMRMGADHQRSAAIDKMAKTHFLRSCLGVKIENHGIGLFAQWTGLQDFFAALKRIIKFRMHENAAHDIGDQNPRAISCHVKT